MATEQKATPLTGRVRTGRELAETPGLIDVPEVSSILHICTAQVYTLANRGEIPSYKIGKRRLFKLNELNDWIQSKQAKQAA